MERVFDLSSFFNPFPPSFSLSLSLSFPSTQRMFAFEWFSFESCFLSSVVPCQGKEEVLRTFSSWPFRLFFTFCATKVPHVRMCDTVSFISFTLSSLSSWKTRFLQFSPHLPWSIIFFDACCVKRRMRRETVLKNDKKRRQEAGSRNDSSYWRWREMHEKEMKREREGWTEKIRKDESIGSGEEKEKDTEPLWDVTHLSSVSFVVTPSATVTEVNTKVEMDSAVGMMLLQILSGRYQYSPLSIALFQSYYLLLIQGSSFVSQSLLLSVNTWLSSLDFLYICLWMHPLEQRVVSCV